MTDEELVKEMTDTANELHRQSWDVTLTEQELRITMRVTEILIDKWIQEIPVSK